MMSQSQYKLRFSEDVLPCIDKGYRFVGINQDGFICCNCYSLSECDDSHTSYRWVTYEEFVKENRHMLFDYVKPSLKTFQYIFKDGNYKKESAILFHCRNLRHCLQWGTSLPFHCLPGTASI